MKTGQKRCCQECRFPSHLTPLSDPNSHFARKALSATPGLAPGGLGTRRLFGETLKGLYLKGLLSKHRSIACPLPLALASDLPGGVCTCKWDLQVPSPVRLWTDFPRPRGWRVTTALGNPFPCRTALGNPFPCKVCFAQKAPLDKPPLRLPDFCLPVIQISWIW